MIPSNSNSSTNHGVVAAGDERTAATGVAILKSGGNAIDAAVGATFAAFVTEPVLTSPFGGGFATVATGEHTSVYDFFAAVPGCGLPAAEDASTRDFLPLEVSFGATTQIFHVGRGATATPLLLPGLVALQAEHGRLSLEEVAAPAIELAEKGVAISNRLASFLVVLEPILRLTPAAANLFAPTGGLLQAGEAFTNAGLGRLLRRVVRGEQAAIYEALLEEWGPPAGAVTEADLAGTTVERVAPLHVRFCGYDIVLNPPPSAGGLLIAFGLRLLESVPASVWRDDVATARHILAAMAITNAARAAAIDDALHTPPTGNAAGATAMQQYLADSFVDPWREEFLRAARDGLPEAGSAQRDLGSTTHLSVLDTEGSACAITSSNGEGCGHVVRGTGAMANNFMGEEDLHPRGFFSQPAGRRLTSMMCPTLVMHDGATVLALGTGGSNRIRTALLQVLVHHLCRALPIDIAVRIPRMHYEGSTLFVEAKGPDMPMPTGVLEALRRHAPEVVLFEAPNMFFGGVHAAATGQAGAGDPRRGGAVCRT